MLTGDIIFMGMFWLVIFIINLCSKTTDARVG
jgi:hypothetical protein